MYKLHSLSILDDDVKILVRPVNLVPEPSNVRTTTAVARKCAMGYQQDGIAVHVPNKNRSIHPSTAQSSRDTPMCEETRKDVSSQQLQCFSNSSQKERYTQK
jgi:hypothetical protein